MAFETEFPIRLAQQFLLVGRVRLVAGRTFAILDRLMFYLCRSELFRNVVMTLETEFAVRLEEQSLRVGRMRIMATQAFAVFGRLMLGLCDLGKRIMTDSAQILTCLHQHLRIDRKSVV